MATRGHSEDEFIVGCRFQVSRVEDLATDEGDGGCRPSHVGEFWDAAAGGRSESVFTVDHRSQVSEVKDLATAESDRGCWPSHVSEL